MRWLTDSPRMSLSVVGVLVLLLVILATLQYRWIAQLSDAEQARLKANLDQTTANFCDDFDREIARAVSTFGPGQPENAGDLSQFLARRMGEWREASEWPEIVRQLIVLRDQEPDDAEPLCFDERSQTLVQCDPDVRLQEVPRNLRADQPGMPVIAANLPAVFLPIQEGPGPGKRMPFERQPPRDHLVILFDLEFIIEEFLPQLTERHFQASGGLPYLLTAFAAEGPRTPLFQAGSPPPGQLNKPDSTRPFFGLRSFPEFSNTPIAGPRRHQHDTSVAGQPFENRPRPQRNPPPPGLRPRLEEGIWILAVHHSAGSLEKVVASARRRNMAISLAILAMLFATALIMLVSTRQAQRLARQQMAFVATISHELRTPLTAIRSAGQNLAQGIISDPPKVRDYGLLIEREGRRLTEMIGRVLAYAGIRSGRQIFRMVPVDIPEIVEAALDDSRWILEEKSIDVDQDVAPDLPSILGDASALRLVVSNLIDNAIKYGAPGRWLGVSAGLDTTQTPPKVWVSISDHGPGIPRREQRHLFEAFRRGADAAKGTIPGSGLGLAVVRGVTEAHGGSIDIISTQENGTTFTVRLPAKLTENQQGEES